MSRKVIALLDNPDGRAMIEEVCEANGLVFSEFQDLVEAEIKQMGKERRRGLTNSFDVILDRIKMEDRR